MKSDNENRWWDIFKNDKKTKPGDECPAVPVSTGRAWQKGLANLYCPCRSDQAADECRPSFI